MRVLLLVCLKEFGVLLHCYVPSNQFGSVMKLLRARNTSRHEQPLNMTTHKIPRHVTTHADNNDWGGGCAHISIHSYYHTLHHICSTNAEESCTSKLAAALYIAQFRWISELTDRCSLVYPQVFLQSQMISCLDILDFSTKLKKTDFSGSRKIWLTFEPDFSGTR